MATDDKAAGAGTPEAGGAEKPAEQKPAEQKPAEQKPAEQKPAEKPADKAGEKPAETPAEAKGEPASKDGVVTDDTPKAPEKYTLTIPEDATAYVDAADLKQLEAIGRKQGLSNEQLQAAVVERATAIAEQSATFRAETEADPIYGGEHLKETQRLAALALERMAPVGDPLGDALRRDLVKSGFGNKLSVVAALARLGRLMAEDSPARGSGGSVPAKRDAATVLYGEEKSA